MRPNGVDDRCAAAIAPAARLEDQLGRKSEVVYSRAGDGKARRRLHGGKEAILDAAEDLLQGQCLFGVGASVGVQSIVLRLVGSSSGLRAAGIRSREFPD